MLEIKVQGLKGFLIKWEVDIGALTIDLLMNVLAKEVQWSSRQCGRLWFFDKNLGEDVRLVNDRQLLDMFSMYKAEMCCQVLLGVFDNSVSTADDYAELEPLCVIPPDDDQPSQVNPPQKPEAPEPKKHNIEAPEPTKNMLEPTEATTKEPDFEPAREPDMFDNEEEYVGVDDEHIYISVPPAQPTTNATATHPVDDNSDYIPAEGGVPLEAEVNDADPQEINVLHDPENPNIVKGALFPDIIAFRKAVRHYAVITGFEFADVKTDKTRFIAKCKAEGCPWRIHASRIYDGKTIEVQSVSFLFFYSKLSVVYFCNMYWILLQIKVLPAEHKIGVLAG